MTLDNATVTVKKNIGRNGSTLLTRRGRVTPKRIEVYGRMYRRDNGRPVGKTHPSMTFIRVIAYLVDGEELVTIR